jgi:macrolide phosphotransferase
VNEISNRQCDEGSHLRSDIRQLLTSTAEPSYRIAFNIIASMSPAELDACEVSIIDDGWDFRIFRVSDYVLRVARRPDVVDDMEREIRLLDIVRATITISVPQPGIYTRGVSVGPWLPGRPLSEQDVPEVAAELAAALAALHARDLPDWFPADQRHADFHRERAAVTLDQARKTGLNCPEMDLLRVGLADDGLWEFTAVPTHGDLMPKHVLVADDRPRLTGLLDWTDARYDDPAIDLAGVHQFLGEAACASLCEAYLGQTDPGKRFNDRVRFRAAWAYVLEAYATPMPGCQKSSSLARPGVPANQRP